MAPYANMALPENDFRISEVTRRRFEEFYDIYRSGADAKTKEMRLRALSNSWFCYATQK